MNKNQIKSLLRIFEDIEHPPLIKSPRILKARIERGKALLRYEVERINAVNEANKEYRNKKGAKNGKF